MKLKPIFQDANGFRVVWRLLIFLVVFTGLRGGDTNGGEPLRAVGLFALEMALGQGRYLPQGLLIERNRELVSLAVALARWLVSSGERLPTTDFRRAGDSVRRLCEGVAWGLAMVTAMVLLQRAENVFDFGTLALSGSEAARMGLLWGAATLLVGLFEELFFRGYIQYTLASGMGFWRAAAVSSLILARAILRAILFRLGGLILATLAGLLFCLSCGALAAYGWPSDFIPRWIFRKRFSFRRPPPNWTPSAIC